jgi:WD40 repeat protein
MTEFEPFKSKHRKWNAEEALVLFETLVEVEDLRDIQVTVFREVWQGSTYEAIAEKTGYSNEYIKHVGSELWKMLSAALGRKVTKRNLRSALRKYFQQANVENNKTQYLEAKVKCVPQYSTSIQCDWGDAIDVSVFFGRHSELNTLNSWVINDSCRLVCLTGIGGIGKTALAAKLAEIVQDQFEYVIWRSLRNGPCIEDLLQEWILFLSNQQETASPKTIDGKMLRLIHYLRSQRCLLVLDNFESVLEPCDRTGGYRDGYSGYGQLLRSVGEVAHQSCLLLTSREKPKGLAAKEGTELPVRSFQVEGLLPPEGKQLFLMKGQYCGTEQAWENLISHYRGNPLALKMVAATVLEKFGGSITQFVDYYSQYPSLCDDIHDLIHQQFERLSPLEREVMYWLAINRDWVSVQTLQADLLGDVSEQHLIETLRTLSRRSLIESAGERFTQQPVIMEYVTEQLIEAACAAILGGSPDSLNSFALLKAQAEDYIQASQTRFILSPLVARLKIRLGSQEVIKQYLDAILEKLRDSYEDLPGYGAGNLVHLFQHLRINLADYDFSNLSLWQVDFRQVALHYVNFRNSDLSHAVFSEPLNTVLALAISPCGNFLAAADVDGEIHLWSIAERKKVLFFKAHGGWVWSLRFSPDGKTLASGSGDQTIKLWNAETGECLNTFRGHTKWVLAVAFSHDGQLLASGGDDQTIKIWDLHTGQCARTFPEESGWVLSLAFGLDGHTIAAGTSGSAISLWNAVTGEHWATLQGHTSQVQSVAFTPDGQTLVSGSHDHTLKVWQIDSRKCLRTLSGHRDWVLSVTSSSDGQYLASGSKDEQVKLWDLKTGQCLRTLQGHTNWVLAVAFIAEHNLLASGGLDQSIKLWNIRTSRCLRTLQGYTNQAHSLAFSPVGNVLASSHHDCSIKLWNLETGECYRTLEGHSSWGLSVAFSPFDKILASTSNDGTIKLWHSRTGRCLKTLCGHGGGIWSVAFHPDGQLLASGSDDQTIKLWQVRTGQCTATLKDHGGWVWAVAFSPDGQLLASGSDDQTVKLWEVKTGQCLKTLEQHSSWLRSIAFHPAGHILASGSGDQTIKLWDIHTGQCLETLKGHRNGIWAVVFSADGQILASGSDDQTIKLWDTVTGECLRTLTGHRGRVWALTTGVGSQLSLHVDNVLASASQDETIKLWDLKTGRCFSSLKAAQLYEGMDITGVRGLTQAQARTLKTLGATSGL